VSDLVAGAAHEPTTCSISRLAADIRSSRLDDEETCFVKCCDCSRPARDDCSSLAVEGWKSLRSTWGRPLWYKDSSLLMIVKSVGVVVVRVSQGARTGAIALS
jgi:hypothetical protein